MCIGIPMTVLEVGLGFALCEGRGEQKKVNTLLVGGVAPGAMLLVHIDSALRPLEADEAAAINDALDALDSVMNGGSADGFFADLVDREPQLPPAILAQMNQQTANS